MKRIIKAIKQNALPTFDNTIIDFYFFCKCLFEIVNGIYMSLAPKRSNNLTCLFESVRKEKTRASLESIVL